VFFPEPVFPSAEKPLPEGACHPEALRPEFVQRKANYIFFPTFMSLPHPVVASTEKRTEFHHFWSFPFPTGGLR
jgi:hypothetical protein